VEKRSQTKKIAALQARVKELEHLVGIKQIQLEFSEKMVELGSQEAGFDFKKVRFKSIRYFWQHRKEMSCSLNMFYTAVGIRKQNFHRKVHQEMKKTDQFNPLEHLVSQIRRDHPRMSVLKIYDLFLVIMNKSLLFLF